MIGQITPIISTESFDLSAYGEKTTYPGEGEYEIFLGADNTRNKPIIVVDILDTNDFRYINIAGRGTTNNMPFDNTFLPNKNAPMFN